MPSSGVDKRKKSKKVKKSTRTIEDDLAMLGNLTYLDMFPYRPAYEFNGFRTAFGALCSLAFLFAITLNFMSEIGAYIVAPPIIKQSLHLLSTYKDSKTVPISQLGVRFRAYGNQEFFDPKYFTFKFLQGESFQGGAPVLRDAGARECEIVDPDGLVKYPSLRCPISDMSMQGSENTEYFRFVRVAVEQCVNWTMWVDCDDPADCQDSDYFDADQNKYAASEECVEEGISEKPCYVVEHGSTMEPGTQKDHNQVCAPQEDIDFLLKHGTFTMFFLESDMSTDTEDKNVFEWLRKDTKHALQNIHTMFTSFMQLKKIETTTRYPFSSGNKESNFLKQTSQEVALSDLALTFNPCNTNLECQRPHLYRLAFQYRLDSIYQKQIREPVRLYTMLEAFGGVTFFFLVIFGGAATYFNKTIFTQQTKGLDLRKLDASQFDKFGNLIDKSFQMPRELQDMTAE